MSFGEPRCIHPAEKQKVGQRLALWALAKTYGFDALSFSGPVYESKQVKDNKVILSFNHAHNGLTPAFYEVEGFEIAGSDGVYTDAKARVTGPNTITAFA